jgi:hypothetical protein
LEYENCVGEKKSAIPVVVYVIFHFEDARGGKVFGCASCSRPQEVGEVILLKVSLVV